LIADLQKQSVSYGKLKIFQISWGIKERKSIANNQKHSIKQRKNAVKSKNGVIKIRFVGVMYQSDILFASNELKLCLPAQL
jgi:hypothetical protein